MSPGWLSDRWPPRKLQPHFVYRLFSDDGTLLYVGMSADVDLRIKLHFSIGNGGECGEAIRKYYATHTAEEHPDWWTAHAAEVAAIADEAPLLNKAHNVKRWRRAGNQFVPVTEVSA